MSRSHRPRSGLTPCPGPEGGCDHVGLLRGGRGALRRCGLVLAAPVPKAQAANFLVTVSFRGWLLEKGSEDVDSEASRVPERVCSLLPPESGAGPGGPASPGSQMLALASRPLRVRLVLCSQPLSVLQVLVPRDGRLCVHFCRSCRVPRGLSGPRVLASLGRWLRGRCAAPSASPCFLQSTSGSLSLQMGSLTFFLPVSLPLIQGEDLTSGRW